ncbi:MAG: tripartite tricarboxylate transporter permease [Pseudomonadota bacterium]
MAVTPPKRGTLAPLRTQLEMRTSQKRGFRRAPKRTAVGLAPNFISNDLNLSGVLVASLVFCNTILVILNLPVAGIRASVLHILFRRLVPLIVVFTVIGVYSVRSAILVLHALGLLRGAR